MHIPILVTISGVTSLSSGLKSFALKYCKIFCFKNAGELSMLLRLPLIRYFFALLAAFIIVTANMILLFIFLNSSSAERAGCPVRGL